MRGCSTCEWKRPTPTGRRFTYRLRPASGRLIQGHLESSAVDPIMALDALIGTTKAIQANAKMMQYHDHIMGQAVNTLGRVA